jgi:hypothetical protein
MPMNQTKKENNTQVLYNDRFVDKKHFRAFVYGKNDDVKLANNYDEFENLLASGLWFETPEKAKENLKSGKTKKGLVHEHSG